MRPAWLADVDALRERLVKPEQVAPSDPASELPGYLESFLAHLRLLVGVPFSYLVPDERLLPQESIRFFYLDRSWSDRLVDGALSVGKIGTREHAHHQAQHETLRQRLDLTERVVRVLQRGKSDLVAARLETPAAPAGTITGFLLRSAAVSGWPHMDVRAFREVLEEPTTAAAAAEAQIRTLRLERLAPSILLALFDGVPALVTCDEPAHGVQFGVEPARAGPLGTTIRIVQRDRSGASLPGAPTTVVPVRATHPRVLAIAELRKRLHHAANADARLPLQTGSSALAIELLRLPWRQRFEGAGGARGASGGFVPVTAVAARLADPEVESAIDEVMT